MKIFISSDIEGTTGIANWDETELTSVEGEFFRKQMAKEVNAACVGANKLGCSEIFIKDAHGSGRTIDPSLLPENIKIMRDWARNPLIMMAGIDETFDACLFTGYHSGSSQNGNPLSHTMHCDYDYIKINGKVATEFMINAYTAAMFNVPVVFVSGDEMLCESAKELNPNIVTVPVSKGIGDASISIHPNLALKLIEDEVYNSLNTDLDKYKIELPKEFNIEIHFRQHYRAYKASFYPGVKQIDSQTISFKTNDYYEFLRMLFFM